jgi:hypothetical protein
MRRTVAVLLALCSLAPVGACRTAGPVIGGGDVPGARGTISGTVRGADNTAPAVGRLVEAIEVDTAVRHSATTNITGGFTMMVPKGNYRLKVVLLEGETVAQDPGVIHIGTSDADSKIEIVLAGGSRAAEPRAR